MPHITQITQISQVKVNELFSNLFKKTAEGSLNLCNLWLKMLKNRLIIYE